MKSPFRNTAPGRILAIAAFQFLGLAAVAHAFLDTNSNNLSDIWEKTYNNEQLFPPSLTAASDPDGDGRDNAAEWAMGTNPFQPDPESAFRLTATPSAVEGVHYLALPTTAWKTYQIQTAADLAAWQPQGTPYLGDGRPLRDIVQATLATGGTPSKLFWRAAVTDPDDDGDGLTNWEEHQIGTDPANPDTDGDGLRDWNELRGLTAANISFPPTDPRKADTDGDGIHDGNGLGGLADTRPTTNDADPLITGSDPDRNSLTDPATGQPMTGLRALWTFEAATTANPPAYPNTISASYPLTGLMVSGDADAFISRSIWFSNTGSRLSAPGSVFAGLNDYTISFWCKPDANSISSSSADAGRVLAAFNSTDADTYADFIISARAVGTGHRIEVGRYINSTYQADSYHILTDGQLLDDGNWHHIAVTRAPEGANGGNHRTVTLWVDGATSATATHNSVESLYQANSGSYFAIGRLHPTLATTTVLRGRYDRFAIFDRCLTPAEVTSLYRPDCDHDGLWDITETNTRVSAYASAGHPDPNATPPVTASLSGYRLSPYYANDPSADEDEDGTDNLSEQTGGTNLTEPDSDGDGLPDGWETAHGLDPNTPHTNGPASDRDDQADPDGDGLDNLTEYLNNTNPASANTDGDLTGDALEIAQGSDPADADDGGQPPATAAENITFHVYGDYTQWEATVTGKGPDDWRVRRFRMSAPGQATDQSISLRPGNTYEYSLKYLSTLPDQNVPWYCWESSIAGQTAAAFTLAGKWLVDNSSALLAGHSHSQGTNNVKKKKPVTLAPSDLDIIVPGTEDDATPAEIAEDKEDTEGGVVNVNWDDDNNSGGPGIHGKTDYKSDFEDPPGTKDENDLIRLRLRKAPGATARLKYAGTHIKLWKKADRSEEITSEDTVFDLAEDRAVYAEGLKLTPSGQPVEIQMQIKSPADTTYLPGDTIKLHVATPIMFFSGVNPEMSGEEADSILAAISKAKTVLGKRLVDKRENTQIVKGANRSGGTVYYSVDCFSAITVEAPETRPARPLTGDKEIKMALATEQAHVLYGGHSNFGLGPNFKAKGTTKITDYFNISGHGQAGIILWEKDGLAFSNPMFQVDHGGMQFRVADSEIKGTVQNQLVTIGSDYQIRRFPTNQIELTKKAAAWPVPAYHFTQGPTNEIWVTIVDSTGDLPTLRYASVFMGSCNSGRHFGTSLNHGVLIYTTDETYGVIQDDDVNVESPFTSYIVIEGIILGKSWQNTTSFLNKYRKNKDSSPDNLFKSSSSN